MERPRHGQHPVGRTTTARQDFTLLTRSISVGVWHLLCWAEACAPLLRRTALGVQLAGPFWGPLPASRARKDSAPPHRPRKSGHLPRRSAGALSQRRAAPFVRAEFERYLRCGLLCHGFARVRCTTCHDELMVAFSCKNRGLCPSCAGRRMADSAAHLRDHVFPTAAVRQWVLTLPMQLRFLLAWRPKLIGLTLTLFLRALFAWQRRCARRQGISKPLCGAVTCIQRLGSALNLNLHFHTLVPDGVFSEIPMETCRVFSLRDGR